MADRLLPLDQVTQHLRLVSQNYEGVEPIRDEPRCHVDRRSQRGPT